MWSCPVQLSWGEDAQRIRYYYVVLPNSCRPNPRLWGKLRRLAIQTRYSYEWRVRLPRIPSLVMGAWGFVAWSILEWRYADEVTKKGCCHRIPTCLTWCCRACPFGNKQPAFWCLKPGNARKGLINKVIASIWFNLFYRRCLTKCTCTSLYLYVHVCTYSTYTRDFQEPSTRIQHGQIPT